MGSANERRRYIATPSLIGMTWTRDTFTMHTCGRIRGHLIPNIQVDAADSVVKDLCNKIEQLYTVHSRNNVFGICIIDQHWDGAGSSNPSLSKTRSRLFYVATMAVDGLATQGARASTAMILTWFVRNISVSTSVSTTEWLIQLSKKTGDHFTNMG